MKIYFERTNGNNLVIATENGIAKIYDAAPSGIFEGVDLCAEDAADQLRDRFRALSESGDLNDFSDWCGGDEAEIGPELIEELEEADLVYEDPKKYYFPDPDIADMFFGQQDPICVDEREIVRLSIDWSEPELFRHVHEASAEELAIYGKYDS